ncbi:MAG: hypothetical protein R3Y43_04920 [Alphaproteobacteria bacterium]
MNDITNPNQNFDPNRPRLKKVKRAIKRPEPMADFSDPVYNIEEMESADLSNLDLDSYLDDDAPEASQPASQQTFNAPALATNQQNNLPAQEESPRFLSEEDIDYPIEVMPVWFNKRNVILAICLAFVIGLFGGKMFFTPSSQVVRSGLQGVVPNPEVPKGRARCGLTDKTQGCVLYVMNPQRQDLSGREFYDLAAQLTGRQRFVIETGNMRYSSVKIRPGELAQLNIPPL